MKRVVAVLVGLTLAGVAVSADPAPTTPAAPPVAPAAPAVTSASPPAAAAVTAPEKAVAYRQAEMSLIGKHMKATRMILSGEVARPQDLVRHAEGIHAGSMDLAALFPDGTGPAKTKTEAKAEIWSKHADFEVAVKNFQDASAKLVEVAKTGDLVATKAQLDKVGETCGGCHDTFKIKD